MDHRDSAVKLAMELANLCSFNNLQEQNILDQQSCLSDHFNIGNGQTLAQQINDELKAKKSQNMTECVPVPSSEHVAEIVGRQGCKIKALRAKTNTYIKTPVRGEEPVFVVTGRKEDVGCAKREILSAAEHFSQIRATRKNNINSTLALGQMMANTPGQTTIQVRVPYRVVGLVVGPKGATIKRIQQQTHTYIVTPSRDKEPVFEVTGLPENVEMAKKEIEAHIELRTGGVMDGEQLPGDFGSAFNNGSPVLGGLISDNSNGKSLLCDYNSSNSNSILSRLNSGGSVSSNQSNGLNGGLGSNSGFMSNNLNEMTLNSLLDSNNFDNKFDDKFDSNFDILMSRNNREEGRSIGRSLWGCGDSHDSGIGHSPPYDSPDWGAPSGAIWNELGKVLGNMDSPTERHSPSLLSAAISKPSGNVLSNNPRSASIDLGIPMNNSSSNMISNNVVTSNAGINNHDMSENSTTNHQTNSLPFTLESLSASLNTLSVNQGGDSRQESLLASLGHHHHQHHRNNSPLDQEDNSLTFPSGGIDCNGSGLNKDFLSFSN